MIETKTLKPARKGLVVRDPMDFSILSETGQAKPWRGPAGRYWRRRLADGSCVEVADKPHYSASEGKDGKGGKK